MIAMVSSIRLHQWVKNRSKSIGSVRENIPDASASPYLKNRVRNSEFRVFRF